MEVSNASLIDDGWIYYTERPGKTLQYMGLGTQQLFDDKELHVD